MQDVKKWIAAVATGLAASFCGPAAHAQDCDSVALACSGGRAAAPGSASFLDLMRAADTGRADYAPADPLAHPAVYLPGGAAPSSSGDMAPAGVGALDSAMGTGLSGEDGEPPWLAFPKSLAAPDSSVAWIFAVGFLGFVVLRRVRGANPY